MKNNKFCLQLELSFILPLMCLMLCCSPKGMKVQNLRCEYLDNPLAIESEQPLLSWQLHSAERGKRQTAYRILVSGSLSALKKNKGDYWDTGVVRSSQSVQVKYAGKPLVSRQQLFWKVMVWDENNQSTGWSETAHWAMGLLEPHDWSARWIGAQEDVYPDSTLTYPAPYFRKEFVTDKPVKQAKAYISGLGFYEMYINGKKAGDQVLAPAVTNYDRRSLKKVLYFYDDQSTQRVLYNTMDVTSLLQKGKNAVGIMLGNGWYNQRDRTIEGCMWYDTPRAILQLEIEYKDGTVETIATDESWKCTTGPLLHDAIFTGEVYDARLELGDWNTPGYNDSSWKPSLLVRAPVGKLQAQLAPYDKVTRTIRPVFKGCMNDSIYVYALPEVVSGWAQLRVQGKAGDKVKLRFIGEEKEDFGQVDYYTLKGDEYEQWEPRFTWHAFRYIEVISHDVTLDSKSILVKVVHTDPLKSGEFNCSNELFNALNEVYLRTQQANFHGSISSDCPHRERLAYTGDAQVIVESSLLSFDMTRFYRKWFDDMEDARNKNTGYVPHTAPFGGGGGGPAWGSAYVIMPWAYYCYYGDTTLLHQHYNGMKQWVEYLGTRTDERGIVVKEEPRGWCLGDWCTPKKVEIPESLVNTAYYYHSADLMAKVAHVLGKKEEVVRFIQLAEKIKSDFNTVFFDTATNHYWEGRQGADVFPLAFGMVPPEKKEQVFNALLGHLKQLDYHFDTGILATPLLLKVLTDNGRIDIAYRLMDQRDEPGFGYVLDNKYTGLWERWNGKASRCHPMFGGVVAWLYNSIAGIRLDESRPGMKHIIIAPHPTSSLMHCTASYQSLHGQIRSAWKIGKDGTFYLSIEIPANTTATVFLPNKNNSKNITESGILLHKTKQVKFVDTQQGVTRVQVASGIYNFAVK